MRMSNANAERKRQPASALVIWFGIFLFLAYCCDKALKNRKTDAAISMGDEYTPGRSRLK